MRAAGVVLVALLVATAGAGSGLAAEHAGGDAEACVAACDAALDACRARADAKVEACRQRAFEPCKQWCPCDQFIGAAHFACLLECDRCTRQAEGVAAECPDGSAAKAACAADHRRCKRACTAAE
jgi:hypothetical protein